MDTMQDLGLDSPGAMRRAPDIAAADTTLQERVASWLRTAILSGRFAPGERLVQADIAETLRVSITPVREAMRDLAADGLLTLSRRRGMTVRVLTLEEVRELRMLSAMLERKCGSLIVERITEEELRHAAWLEATMASMNSLPDYYALNSQFHLFLYETARSPQLTAILRRVHDAKLAYLPATFLRAEVRHQDGLKEHRDFISACRARDPAAAGQIMMQHFDVMFGHIEEIVAEQSRAAGPG